MDNNLIIVKNFTGEGYKSLVSYGAWRVAILRYSDELEPINLKSVERHTSTDEVFILTGGKVMLILGGNGPEVGELSTFVMKTGEIYNVKKNTWHTVLVSHDAHLVIFENEDTGEENSEHFPLSTALQDTLQELAKQFLPQ